jgi:hypothetical protein
VDEKRCFKCGQRRPIGEFYKHPQMADGRLNKCRDCTREDVSKNRIERIAYYRQYDRHRASMPHRVSARKAYKETEAGKMAHKRATKAYQANRPDRKAAHITLGSAIRDGRVLRQPCLVCGEKAEAHHPDYSRPLDVVWLCKEHHTEVHRMARCLSRQEREAA